MVPECALSPEDHDKAVESLLGIVDWEVKHKSSKLLRTWQYFLYNIKYFKSRAEISIFNQENT